MAKESKDAPYNDVSTQLDQSQKDAEKPAEFDDDGNRKLDKPSEATAELYAEGSRRASGAANGGGPWPQEVLERNFIGNQRKMTRPEDSYTSHES